MHRSIRLLARQGHSLLRRQLLTAPVIGVVPERFKHAGGGGSGVKDIKGRKFNKATDEKDEGDEEKTLEDKEFSIDDRYE